MNRRVTILSGVLISLYGGYNQAVRCWEFFSTTKPPNTVQFLSWGLVTLVGLILIWAGKKGYRGGLPFAGGLLLTLVGLILMLEFARKSVNGTKGSFEVFLFSAIPLAFGLALLRYGHQVHTKSSDDREPKGLTIQRETEGGEQKGRSGDRDTSQARIDCKYWAFISYSSRDAAWGRWLHRAIESYGIPAQLIDHPMPSGHLAPKRFHPLFRDRDELPASSDLGTRIEQALRASHYLIVVCSPDAARSRWVGKEIEYFTGLGRQDQVLAVIVEGEPDADEERECFPPQLRKFEPIAADARPGGDGKTNAKLKLLAGMLGVSFDALKQRDTHRRIRRRQLTAATALALTIGFAALAWYGKTQRESAQQERSTTTALTKQKRHLLFESYLANGLQQMEEGNFESGLGWLAEALHTGGADAKKEDVQRLRIAMALNNVLPLKQLISLDNRAEHILLSPTARILVSRCADGLSAWDLKAGTSLWRVNTAKGHLSRMGFLHADTSEPGLYWTFSGDERWLCLLEVKSRDDRIGDLSLIEISSGKVIPIQKGAKPSSPSSARMDTFLTLNHDGRWLITRQRGGTITVTGIPGIQPTEQNIPENTALLWNTKTGETFELRAESEGLVSDLVFSPDGNRLAVAGEDQTAMVWDVSGSKPMFQKRFQHQKPAEKKPDVYDLSLVFKMRVDFSPDGTRLLTAGHDKVAQIWDVASGQKLTPPMLAGSPIIYAKFSPDGRRVIAVNREYKVGLWDSETGNPLLLPEMPAAGSYASDATATFERGDGVSFSPDGTVFFVRQPQGWGGELRAAVDGSLLGLIEAAPDYPTGKVIPAREFRRPLGCLCFSPDSKFLIETARDNLRDEGPLRIWNARDGRQVLLPVGDSTSLKLARIDADGNLLTISDDGCLALWSLQQRPLHRLSLIGRSNFKEGCFSPDSEQFLAVLTDGSVAVWDLRTGTNALVGQTQNVSHAHYDSSGKFILAITADNSVQVCNVQSRIPLTSPLEHNDDIYRLAVTDDGTVLMVCTFGPDLRHSANWSHASQSRQERTLSLRSFEPYLRTSRGGRIWFWDIHNSRLLNPPIPLLATNNTAVWAVEASVYNASAGLSSLPAPTDGFRPPPILSRDGLSYSVSKTFFVKPTEEFQNHQYVQALGMISDQSSKSMLGCMVADAGGLVAVICAGDSREIWDPISGRGGGGSTGTTLAGGIGSRPESPQDTIQIWDMRTGRPVRRLPSMQSNETTTTLTGRAKYRKFSHVVFNQDATLVVTVANAGQVVVWDLASDKAARLKHPSGDGFDRACFTSDGRSICAVNREGKVGVWESDSLKLQLAGSFSEKPINDHAAHLMITNNLVRLIADVDPNRAKNSLAHKARVVSAKASPSWRFLVTLTEDNVLRFWEPMTSQAISPPLKWDSPIKEMQFSPDDFKLLVVSDAHVGIINLKLFDRSSEELLLLARVVSRLQTDAEGNLQTIEPGKRQEYWQAWRTKYARATRDGR